MLIFVLMAILLQSQRHYTSGTVKVLAWFSIVALTFGANVAIYLLTAPHRFASAWLFDIIIGGWPLSMVLRWLLNKVEIADKRAASGTVVPSLDPVAGSESQ